MNKIAVKQTEAKEGFFYNHGVFTLPAWEDTRNLLDREADFKSYFSENYKTWNIAQPQIAQSVHKISILNMQPGKNGEYKTIYNMTGHTLDECVMDEVDVNQILFDQSPEAEAVRAELALKATWTQFLIKRGENFFVVGVGLHSDGLLMRVHNLLRSDVWKGGREYRFVLPA